MQNRRYGQGNLRQKQLRNWLILIGAAVILLLAILISTRMAGTTDNNAVQLPCSATQEVTPFGDYVLYYDGVSIHCLTDTGSVRWSQQLGSNASFYAGDAYVIAWAGNQLYIIDQSGRPTYNDDVGQAVQFARVGAKYAAAVIGPTTSPTLRVKDLSGVRVDEEPEAFATLMLLDVGFYGNQGQYMWTLSLDLYGTAANTIMNIFEVGKMNAGVVSLGEPIAYKVLFENNLLRVIGTRQMRTFDYKGVEDATSSMLVYGWRLLNAEVPQTGNAMMLFAPTSQTNSTFAISELRMLSGTVDRRLTLPSTCVGAGVYKQRMYAFSSDYIYRAAIDAQRFTAYAMPEMANEVTSLIGFTTSGRAVLAAGDMVYTVPLPVK